MAAKKKKKAQKRERLSRERVIAAALSLADGEGVEAVTMRALAARLSVEAMSLYKHVADKDAVLDGMLDVVVSEMAFVVYPDDWQASLRSRAARAREVLLRHRWAAALIESRTTPTEARLQLNESVLQVLRSAGFSTSWAHTAFLTLDSYIYGFALQEASWPFDLEEDAAEVMDALAPSIPVERYPRLVEMMGHVAHKKTGLALEFRRGLDVLLDGLSRAREQKARS